MIQPTQKRLYKTKEAAKYLGCSAWKVRDLARRGMIPIVPFDDSGQDWHFDVCDLDRLVESRKQLHA
jgi:excisionase family DNA binding protein